MARTSWERRGPSATVCSSTASGGAGDRGREARSAARACRPHLGLASQRSTEGARKAEGETRPWSRARTTTEGVRPRRARKARSRSGRASDTDEAETESGQHVPREQLLSHPSSSRGASARRSSRRPRPRSGRLPPRVRRPARAGRRKEAPPVRDPRGTRRPRRAARAWHAGPSEGPRRPRARRQATPRERPPRLASARPRPGPPHRPGRARPRWPRRPPPRGRRRDDDAAPTRARTVGVADEAQLGRPLARAGGRTRWRVASCPSRREWRPRRRRARTP